MTTELDWFKSSYSGNDGPDCVEAAISPTPHPTTIHIRDSKNRHGSRLAFTGGRLGRVSGVRDWAMSRSPSIE